jgi:hypothetical protein
MTPTTIKEMSDAADDAASLLTLIETAAASITETTADDRDGVIEGFRHAEAICCAARMARERLGSVQERLMNA